MTAVATIIYMVFPEINIIPGVSYMKIDFSGMLPYADYLKEKVYYSGAKVPIFAISQKGKEFLDNRLEKIGKSLTINDYPMNKDKHPTPLI